ncbi:MAG: SDR family oxidoreductase [Gammaproteobacteria bacterium]|nr:SDR family oxidoreductase [Gammaproteobacteria bacterium]
MGGRLEGKIAVITGGTSGIGESTAETFVREGARVVITGRSAEKGAAIAHRLGSACFYVPADVMTEAGVRAGIETAVQRFGGLDIVFNNAGGPTAGGLTTITAEQIDYGVHLLLSSVIFGIKHAVPHLESRGGGSIINCSSVAGIRYNQGNILYSVLKAAVTHYTRLASVDLGPKNIRINAISPGAIATPIFWGGSARANQLSADDNIRKLEKLKANLAKATPLPRAGLADDIAHAALFLASEEGSYVNGHDLVVDGGRTQLFRE